MQIMNPFPVNNIFLSGDIKGEHCRMEWKNVLFAACI